MTGRIADLPLEERRKQDAEKQRELDEGLTRQHLAKAAFQRASLADQISRIPILAAKVRGE